MSLPLQVANGRFAAKCSLLGNPDQELLGVIDTGATVTCVDARVCRLANLRFSGDVVLRCVHQSHRDVVSTRFGDISICGVTVRTTIHELDMGPESARGGVNAILGWDVLGEFRVTLDRPCGTGMLEQRAPGQAAGAAGPNT